MIRKTVGFPTVDLAYIYEYFSDLVTFLSGTSDRMLPPVLLFKVFNLLDVKDKCKCRQICTQWRDIIDGYIYWPISKVGFYIGNERNFEVSKKVVYPCYWINNTDEVRMHKIPAEIYNDPEAVTRVLNMANPVFLRIYGKNTTLLF